MLFNDSCLLITLYLLAFSLSLAGQQRIQPVGNFSIERVNQYSDAVNHELVINDILYFSLDATNSESIYATDGTANGTRQVSKPEDVGGRVVFSFSHNQDYYYVAQRFREASQLRRVNYASGVDERVMEIPVQQSNNNYRNLDLGAQQRSLFTWSNSDSTYSYLIEETGELRPLSVASGLNFTDVHHTSDQRTLLTAYGGDDRFFMVGLDFEEGELDTLIAFPASDFFTSPDIFGDHIYFRARIGEGTAIFVYGDDGTSSDTLNYGPDLYLDPFRNSFFDGRGVYYWVDGPTEAVLHYYRPEDGGRDTTIDEIKVFAWLVAAPGPLGELTIYYVTLGPNNVLNINFLDEGRIVNAVVQIPLSEDEIFGHNFAIVTPQGVLYQIFRQGDPLNRSRLLFTDGTIANSRFIGVEQADDPLSFTGPFSIVDGALYISANTQEEGIEVYRMSSDGRNVEKLTDIHRDAQSNQSIFNLLPFRGGVVFRAAELGDNTEWWIARPDRASAKKIVELDPDGENSKLVLLGERSTGELLFTAGNARNDVGFFRTMGSPASTELIRRGIYPLANRQPLRFGDDILFLGRAEDEDGDGSGRFGLIRTDGTAEGTYSIFQRGIHDIVVSGEQVFIAGGKSLYVSDGTMAGTREILNLMTTIGVTTPSHLTAFRGGVLFTGVDQDLSFGVWFSDGTPGGTRIVKEFSFFESDLVAFAAADEIAYFMEEAPSTTNIWRTDGTAEGTVLITTLDDGTDRIRALESTIYDDRFYFTGFTQTDGWKIWVTDGTEAGTRMLPETSGRDDSFISGRFFSTDDYLYYHNALGLFRIDGTDERIVMIFDEWIQEITDYDGRIYFTATEEETGLDLYVSDGTIVGTEIIEDNHPGSEFSFIRNLTSTESGLYFSAMHPDIGLELHTLIDCIMEDALTPLTPTACVPVMTIPIGSSAGVRTVDVVSSDGQVRVDYYANCIEIIATAGARLTGRVSVEIGGACGEVIRDFTTVMAGAEPSCLTAVQPAESPMLLLNMYPNPSLGQVKLNTPDSGVWQLYSPDGRRLMEGNTIRGETDISVSHLSPGLYYVIVNTKHNRRLGRLVKE